MNYVIFNGTRIYFDIRVLDGKEIFILFDESGRPLGASEVINVS